MCVFSIIGPSDSYLCFLDRLSYLFFFFLFRVFYTFFFRFLFLDSLFTRYSGRGFITTSSLLKVFPSFIDSSLSMQILQQFDVDHNGKLGWLEFKDAMKLAKDATKIKNNY